MTAAGESGQAELHFERRGGLGVITLDRPKALNALTPAMVKAMGRQAAAWRDDDAVRAVVVRAVPGRAFCAGGDVRTVSLTVKEKGVGAALPFFFDEYRLNWRIGTFPKPWIALIDGITMGGGVGISVHGRYRIATENTLFAMPETGIGFFPDVGGSHFLPRLPGAVGTWLGLTGDRLDGEACAAAGIATHLVAAADIEGLLDRLADAEDVATVLEDPASGRTGLEPDHPAFARARFFEAPSLAGIVGGLERSDDPVAAEVRMTLQQKSPLGLAVTFAQLKRGRTLDLAAAMRMEYRMVQHALAGQDFHEGVRALLIDKDKQPRWRHDSIEAVTQGEVEAFFAPGPAGELPLDWDDNDKT